MSDAGQVSHSSVWNPAHGDKLRQQSNRDESQVERFKAEQRERGGPENKEGGEISLRRYLARDKARI